MRRVIHVNQHVIKSNRRLGKTDPVITVKTYKSNTYGYEAEFTSGKVVYSPDKPLSCGAHVWIETHEPVYVDGVKI